MLSFAARSRSEHQMNVDQFMLRGGQEVPLEPTMPSDEVLVLRAKLILEEALETVHALGVSVQLKSFETKPYTLASTHDQNNDPSCRIPTITPDTELHFYRDANLSPNFVEIVDGCCDLRVVTTGTLSAIGVSDIEVQDIVDHNNLSKFAPGWYKREDGKIMKPPSYAPPTDDLRQSLYDQLDPESYGPSKLKELGFDRYYAPYTPQTTEPYQATARRATRLEASSAGYELPPAVPNSRPSSP